MKKSLFVMLLAMVTLGACAHTSAERGTASEDDVHYKASHFDKRVR